MTPFPSLEFAWNLAARWMQPAFAGAFVVVQALAFLYSSHRWLVLWRSWRGRRAGFAKRPPGTVRECWPPVTVQLPI